MIIFVNYPNYLTCIDERSTVCLNVNAQNTKVKIN